jgi:hypothetical protein
VELKYLQHLADDAKIIEAKEHKNSIIYAYTDVSKTKHRVESRVVIFFEKELAVEKISS